MRTASLQMVPRDQIGEPLRYNSSRGPRVYGSGMSGVGEAERAFIEAAISDSYLHRLSEFYFEKCCRMAAKGMRLGDVLDLAYDYVELPPVPTEAEIIESGERSARIKRRLAINTLRGQIREFKTTLARLESRHNELSRTLQNHVGKYGWRLAALRGHYENELHGMPERIESTRAAIKTAYAELEKYGVAK